MKGRHIITRRRFDIHKLIFGGDLLEWQDLHPVFAPASDRDQQVFKRAAAPRFR
ncbi:Uncharacterised protein [Salmonella enterica subsp. arizonae]|uniref:Uncharacterized protein n=1 Tax=Salmonella enterica subsp. arizonae TaxID=59203 RepID=A0A447R5A1_SALER|nr:Uncharacterised protein [Salmonella enterica subsp. arizonae]